VVVAEVALKCYGIHSHRLLRQALFNQVRVATAVLVELTDLLFMVLAVTVDMDMDQAAVAAVAVLAAVMINVVTQLLVMAALHIPRLG
jgi:hypothetical protein